MTALVLGPMVRHVGARTVHVWVEVSDPAHVSVHVGDRSWRARTFAVHGHHYALVRVDGLEPGSDCRYTVALDGEQVWPLEESPLPAGRLRTLDPDRPARVAYGSCRTSVPHDAEHNASHGVDALRALAVDLAADAGSSRWPDLMVFLGDQVYADETSAQMQEFIERRRGLEAPPGPELKDFEEYAHLYHLAWTEPTVRWVLSTVPSVMIFDDHDVRDDWNTSDRWHQQMRATGWWRERLLGALTSYWVYQHLGNLSPDDLARDRIWQQVIAHEESGAPDELDLTAPLRDLAAEVDRDPGHYRFSYIVELSGTRLVMVDSRAARELTSGRRNMLCATEMDWLDTQLVGGVDHLLIGTSLPFLLPPALHAVEAWNEQLAEGSYGHRWTHLGEKIRQGVDLEHWAAFERGLHGVAHMVTSVARGERGPAPATITFLSGDVHHSYVARVDRPHVSSPESQILQLVCSPIRNPLPRHVQVLMAGFGRVMDRPLRMLVSRSRHVPDPPWSWSVTDGPWFDNNVGLLQVDGQRLHLTWYAGAVEGRAPHDPTLRTVTEIEIGAAKG